MLYTEIDKLMSYQQFYRREEMEHPEEAKYTIYLRTIDMCFSFLARMVPKQYLALNDEGVPASDIDKLCEKADIVIQEFQEFRRDVLYHDFWDVLRIMQNLLQEWSTRLKRERMMDYGKSNI